MATRFVLMALLCLGLTCGLAPAQNLLANPDFEAGDTGWNKFANAFIEGTPNGDPCISPQSGAWCAKMFGNWWGVFNVSGMFQEFPANGGDQFEMDCASRHCAADPMIGGGAPNDNWVVMKVAFFDAGGNEIAGAEQTICDGNSPMDTWIDNPSVLATAPAGTATVQALLLYLQPMFDGGAVQVDDVSFSPTMYNLNNPGASLDINGSTSFVECQGTPGALTFSSNAIGSPFDIAIGTLAATPVPLIDDLIELDLATATSIFGGAVGQNMPNVGLGFGVGSVTINFVAMPTSANHLQGGALDPTDPDGISLSEVCHYDVDDGSFQLTLGDDDNVQIMGACFNDVNFYGTTYDHCYVGSNGDVSFTVGSNDFSATYVEWASGMPRIGWAADLEPNNFGTVSYVGLLDGFRVDYTDVTEWGTGGTAVISFSVEVSATAGASITGITEDGTWGGTSQCLGATNGNLGTDPGPADFMALFALGGAGAGAASDMWVNANALGMIPGAGSTYTDILFPAADGSSIVIN